MNDLKDCHINIRISSCDKEKLQEKAARCNLSISQYIIHSGLGFDINSLSKSTDSITLDCKIFSLINQFKGHQITKKKFIEKLEKELNQYGYN